MAEAMAKGDAMIVSSLIRIGSGIVQAAVLGGVGWTAVHVMEIPTINVKLDDHTRSIEAVKGDLKDYAEKQGAFREQVIRKVGEIDSNITAVKTLSDQHTQALKAQVDTTSALAATVSETNSQVRGLSIQLDDLGKRVDHRVTP
jgi:uncharacterized protein YceH (UPF0502 family)